MSKILIIEDNPVIVQLLTGMLQANKFSVVIAGDGEEGLRKTESEKPNLIILDVMMPKMTGYQFFQALKEKTDLRKIPVIVMSTKESMRSFFNVWEIVDFIPKPFDVQVMLSKVKSVLDMGDMEPPPTPVEKEKTTAVGQGKKIMVIALEDFLFGKIKAYFDERKISTIRGLDAQDVVKTAIKDRPDVILCQYCEDPKVINAPGIQKALKGEPDLSNIKFYSFVLNRDFLQAAKDMNRSMLIEFNDSNTLLKALDETLVSAFAGK